MSAPIGQLRTPGVVHFGPGSIEKLKGEAAALDATRALVVTDPGLAGTPMVATVQALLSDAGLGVETFADVVPEPPIGVVEAALEQVRNTGCDLLVGVGGGSSLDVVKVVSVLATNEGDVRDYFGTDLVPKPGLPKVLVPTTAGTGSEVTPIAILTDTEAKVKKGIVSPFLYGHVSIVDPELTHSLPPAITAATGMDALTHAIEAFTSVKANPLSDALALEAMRMIAENIADAYDDGEDADARAAMSLGSMMAGMCLPLAGAGAVHALAYPLGGEFHLSHGQSNTLMLPYVLKFNTSACLGKTKKIVETLGEETEGLTPEEVAARAQGVASRLATRVGMPLRLSDYDVPEAAIPAMAQAASKITRLLDNSARPVSVEEIAAIYREAL